MSTLYVFIFFCFGLMFGSFMNVVGIRIPINESFITGRSYCPSCRNSLSWYELIPLFSFLLQKGKCRNCHGKIPDSYPLIELLTGILFAFSFYKLGFQLELITSLLLTSLLIIVLVTDITYMVIPNCVLLFFFPLFITMRIIQPLSIWWSPILGFIIGVSVVGFIIIISRGGMGAGDMKLLGVLGIILGFENVLLTFFLACITGAIIGMTLLLFNIIKRKQKVPFGPYIVGTAIVSYYYGPSIMTWYLHYL